MGKVTVQHGDKKINYIFLINDLEVPMMDIRNKEANKKTEDKKKYKFFLIMP